MEPSGNALPLNRGPEHPAPAPRDATAREPRTPRTSGGPATTGPLVAAVVHAFVIVDFSVVPLAIKGAETPPDNAASSA